VDHGGGGRAQVAAEERRQRLAAQLQAARDQVSRGRLR
jgi:hypothetical protein